MIKKNKKKFKDTVVGSALLGVASIINPTLGSVLEGVLSPKEALKAITESSASPEEKIQLQEFLLKQHEAEVADRASAREREAAVLSAGGSDILQKTIGWSVAFAFIGMLMAVVGVIDVDLTGAHKDMFNVGFGAVSAKMTSIVSYYFGSSIGSKQKTKMIGA